MPSRRLQSRHSIHSAESGEILSLWPGDHDHFTSLAQESFRISVRLRASDLGQSQLYLGSGLLGCSDFLAVEDSRVWVLGLGPNIQQRSAHIVRSEYKHARPFQLLGSIRGQIRRSCIVLQLC